jgi:asparagine synthase (glutamine-hydrolysing)
MPGEDLDLAFGGPPAVVVVDGRRYFREVEGTDPQRRIYLHGQWIGPPLQALLARDELENGFGQFVVLVHDRGRNTLTVQSDRYGLAPLFQTSSGGILYLSNRIRALLERGVVAGQLDPAALADLLAFNVPLGTKTLVRDVRSLGPATRLTIDLLRPRVLEERRWQPSAVLREGSRPYPDASAGLAALFLEGFRLCVEGQPCVGITLSGGIDSRCLLAAGLSLGLPLAAYNASVPGSRSARYAERMAVLCSTPYEAHPIGAEFAESYPERLRKVIGSTEGMTFSSEIEGHWLRDHVSGPSVMLHGAFGELSKLAKMHLYGVDAAVMGCPRSELPQLVWRRFEPWFRAHGEVFSAEIRQAMGGAARQHLVERIEGMDAKLSAPEVMQVLYCEEFLSKVTPYSARIWNERLPLRFPFGYPPYLDALLRVRSEDRMRPLVQMDLLRRTSPDLFAFPDANTGARVDSPARWAKLLGLLEKARMVLTTSRAVRDHSDPLGWFTAMRPSAEELLLAGDSGGLFDRERLGSVLARARDRGDASGFGPVAAVRRRVARYRAAITVEKVLLFQFWRDYMGVTGF